MFRFPEALVDLEQMQQYTTEFWSDVVNFIGVYNDTFEPPVPPGLQALTPALERFVELFDRTAELNALARREDEAWREVDALIQQSQAKAYDEAVRLLKRLVDSSLLCLDICLASGHNDRSAAYENRPRGEP